MKQIHTREQLIHELVEMIKEVHYDNHCFDTDIVNVTAVKIADLIANLPNACFHEEGHHATEDADKRLY